MKRSSLSTLTLFLFLVLAGAQLPGCESELQHSTDDISLQAKNAIDVLPYDPSVVGMINARELSESEMFGMVDERLQGEELSELQSFIEATGFDPKEDLREVYVAIEEFTEHDHPGVSIVAYASIEPARLQSYVEERAGDELRPRTYRGIDLYESGEPGHEGSFSFANEDMILIASRVDLLEDMVDRLIDEGTALSANGELMDLVARASSGKSGWLIAEKPEVELSGTKNTDNAMEETARQIWTALDRVVMAMNVESDEVESQIFLYPGANVSVDDLASLTKGLRAAMRSDADLNEEARKMLDDIRVSSTRDHVRIQFTADNEMIQKIRV